MVLLCLARVCEIGLRYSGGKDVMYSRRSAAAIAPAARKIIEILTLERKLNSTEILRETIYQEENIKKCLVREYGREIGRSERHLSLQM